MCRICFLRDSRSFVREGNVCLSYTKSIDSLNSKQQQYRMWWILLDLLCTFSEIILSERNRVSPFVVYMD